MEMGKYLTRQLTLILKARTKKEALSELTQAMCDRHPDFEFEKIMPELIRRENLLSSRIAPHIALPHALLPDYGRPVVALGYSPGGLPWDSPGDEPVNLVILIICGRKFGNEHVAVMADIANTLNDPSVLNLLSEAGSSDEIYEVFQKPARHNASQGNPGDMTVCRLMLQHAESMARKTDARAVMVIAGENMDIGFINSSSGDVPLIVVTNESGALPVEGVEAEHFLQVPCRGIERSHRVKLSVLCALTSGILGGGDTVVCLSGTSDYGYLDVLEVIDVDREFEILLSLRSELETGDVSPRVFHRVLQLASTLAIEGREGKPVGAIFIIGDYQHVREHCYQMVINPFRGYPENERSVMDPSLEETLKEFSRVDGACLIRGDGIVMSLGVYVQPEHAAKGLQSGLGARHAAGMAITMSTKAVSVVISESTRRISIFQGGRLIAALDRSNR